MKKALVLGVMAIFALGIANVNAQAPKKNVKTKEAVEVKESPNEKEGTGTMRTTQPTNQQTFQADPKNNTTKNNPGGKSVKVEAEQKNANNKPAQTQGVKKEEKKTPASPTKVDNTKKNTKNLNNSVPPKPQTKTPNTNSSNKPTER